MNTKRDVLMVGVALVAGLVGGVASSYFLLSRLTIAHQTPPQAKVIRAEKFELADRSGKIRATLDMGREPMVGQPRTLDEVFRGSGPTLRLYDEGGEIRVELGLGSDGEPGLWLNDKDGRASLALNGKPSLRLNGQEGGYVELNMRLGPSIRLGTSEKLRAELSVLAGLVPNELITYREEKGTPHYRLGPVPREKTGLQFFDEDGKPRVSLGPTSSGQPSLELYDQDGKLRTALGYTTLEAMRTGATENRAVSSLVLFDKNGKVIWQAP